MEYSIEILDNKLSSLEEYLDDGVESVNRIMTRLQDTISNNRKLLKEIHELKQTIAFLKANQTN